MSSLTFDAGIEPQLTSPSAWEGAISSGQPDSKISTSAALHMGRRQFWMDVRTAAPLALADIAAAASAATVALLLSNYFNETVEEGFVPVTILITLLAQFFHGLYPACGMSYCVEFRKQLQTTAYVTIGIGLALFFADGFPWICWLAFSTLFPLALTSLRSLARSVLSTQNWWAQPILVIGNGERAARLFERLSRLGTEGLRPAGFVYTPPTYWSNTAQQHAHWENEQIAFAKAVALRSKRPSKMHVGPLSDLESILLVSGTCRIAVANRQGSSSDQFNRFHGIPHVAVPTEITSHPTENVRLIEADGRVEMHCQTTLTCPRALFIKRAMDLLLVTAAAPAWIPLMSLIAIAIKLTDPGPIFYRQSRVGRFRRPFDALKFRSMCIDADQKLTDYLENNPQMKAEWDATHKLQSDPRITRIGKFLRTTSLDELPQLLNVLRGEMSLVGPRPIIDSSSYDREYIQEHPDVFEMYQMVRPGITGMWQVSGRNSTSYKQRIYFDRFYLHNWSIATDIFILWRTIKTALFREGAC